MLSLIHHYREEYDRIGRADKFRIIDDIMDRVKSRGGRFMEYNQNQQYWEEVSRAAAYNKVSHAFRSLRRANLPPEERRRASSESSSKKPSTSNQNLTMSMGYNTMPGIPQPYINTIMEGYGPTSYPPMPVVGGVPGMPTWVPASADLQPTPWTQPLDPEGKVAGIDALDTTASQSATNDDAQNVCAV